MLDHRSFGAWLKRRRKALDLTQEALARLVGCSVVSIRKIEADEQRPSRQTAERLAQHLQIAPHEHAAFVQFARLGLDDVPPVLPIPAAAQLPQASPSTHRAVSGAAQPASGAPTMRPSGTVTFLFTDIEGSTPLWEREPEQMRLALARHDAILHTIIAKQDGHVYKTIGDAFQAAFAFPAQALAAALAAQRALATQTWETSEPLRVRMGMHVGPAVAEDNDYATTHTLNRVARIMSCGHGGQILLSVEVADLVRRDLPADVTLRDMGKQRMKGLTHLEHLFQVVMPDLPAEFPPLSTMAAQTVPLPHPATSFIGRAAELAEIGALLDDPACRLLTLTGPGGIGKTRLALALAAGRNDHYPNGVWFVNLAPLSSAEGVASAIADIFKLSGLGVVDPKQAVLNYLREKALLLVLDNFEHVLEAADLVTEILAAAPGVQVLITSRERLRVRAERVIGVRGLPVPLNAAQANADSFDALRMFMACVRHSHPQYTLDAADTPAVVQICRLAAGMPLGIELAAAWVPALPVATIAAELAASLDVLETTMRDVPQRHRSARAVFEHSWNLLSAEEQALFRQLSVFRGGFTFQAAQAVTGATRGTLVRLVDKSLLRTERDGRYDLHELLRQFAAEKLAAEPGAEERTREHHSAFFLEWLQRKDPELKGPQQLHALDEIEREFENIRGACYWALQRGQWERLRESLSALGFFMSTRARIQEAITLLQLVLDIVAAAESNGDESAHREGLAAYALTVQSFFFGVLGQVDKQVSCLERSRAAVHQYGTPYEIAIHCVLYASTRVDSEEAWPLFERSLAILREIGETWVVGFVIDNMGWFAFGRGETLEAKRHWEDALALFRAIGEVQGTTDQLMDVGRVAYALGNYDEGRRLIQESLAIQQAGGLKNSFLDSYCQEVLGEIASAQGQFAEAEARFRQQLAILRNLGYRERLSWGLSRLGAAVLAQERLGEAATLLAEALAIAEGCSDQRGISRAHNQLGYLALRQGAPDTARRHWRTAIDTAWRVQDRTQLLVTLDALMGLATLMAQAGDAERAVEVLALVRGAARIDRHTETRAERLLAELEARLSPARFGAAQARGRALELGATVAAMLAEIEM